MTIRNFAWINVWFHNYFLINYCRFKFSEERDLNSKLNFFYLVYFLKIKQKIFNKEREKQCNKILYKKRGSAWKPCNGWWFIINGWFRKAISWMCECGTLFWIEVFFIVFGKLPRCLLTKLPKTMHRMFTLRTELCAIHEA